MINFRVGISVSKNIFFRRTVKKFKKNPGEKWGKAKMKIFTVFNYMHCLYLYQQLKRDKEINNS